MSAECYFTGKKTSRGMTRVWRGQAVSKGGFGLKPTGITRRTFKPNLQALNAIIEDPKTGTKRAVRVRASAKAIRTGLVVKPLKRKFGYTRQKKATA